MKQTIYIFIIILFGISHSLVAQENDTYRVRLNRENLKELEVYDTTIALDFLIERNYDDLTKMQNFEGFNYQKFTLKTKNNQAILSNDSIKITIITKPFDATYFKSNYEKGSSLYYYNFYFREFQGENFEHLVYPKTEVSEINVSINNKQIFLVNNHCRNLYDPELKGENRNNAELFRLNAYIADNGKILLTLFCGAGAGAYKVIYLFDNNGVIKRISAPVI
jgi:hypothetical protein